MYKSSSIARCAVELQALGRYLERREDPGTGIESSPQAWNPDMPARQYYECMSGSRLAILMQRQQTDLGQSPAESFNWGCVFIHSQ